MTIGMTLGVISGVGLWLCTVALLRVAPPLWIQIAPYVGTEVGSRFTWLQHVSATASKVLIHRPQSIWGTDRKIDQLLTQAARPQSLSAFRQEQIRYAGTALLVGMGWILLRLASIGHVAPTLGVAILIAAPIAGGWYAKWSLASKAAQRIIRIEQQLPTILDLLAFALAAGQAVLPALKKVSQMCSGDLAEELEQVVAAVATGIPLSDALDAAQIRVNSNSLSRAVRSLVVALDRGTPLALVLRAQANDARSIAQRHLVELASKKETAMMLPVVFFILPMIVAVALYPGLIALQMM